jgi:hypothetical protein
MTNTFLFVLAMLLAPADEVPAPRWGAIMCYDPATKSVLMFGGNDNERIYGDLWSYSRNKWKKLAEHGPQPRVKFAFAYDPKRNVAVLFGGAGDNGRLGDTWEWDGKSWTEFKGNGPAPRLHSMAEFDPQSNRIILKGGFCDGSCKDTWAFDGKSWTELIDAGSEGDIPHGMFVDQTTHRLQLISATYDPQKKNMNNTKWTLNNGRWEAPEKIPSTSSGSLQSMTCAGGSDIIIFDGDDVKDGVPATIRFSNGKWNKEYLKGPTPRLAIGLIYNPDLGGVLLFGGSDRTNFFNDTWLLKNNRWTKL